MEAGHTRGDAVVGHWHGLSTAAACRGCVCDGAATASGGHARGVRRMTQLAHRIDVRSIGRVRVITLDRAAKRNALDEAAVQALERAWRDFAASHDCVAVLRARGPVFTAGLDMNAVPAQFWRAIPALGDR